MSQALDFGTEAKRALESKQVNTEDIDLNRYTPDSEMGMLPLTGINEVEELQHSKKINLCVPGINTETLENLALNQEITFRESNKISSQRNRIKTSTHTTENSPSNLKNPLV